MKLFEFVELKYDDITRQINIWLQEQYSRANTLFSPSSPFGQNLEINKELFRHSILYQKNAVKQLDVVKDGDNEKVIKSAAYVAGHDPTRPISATGVLKYTLKPGINSTSEIKGNKIVIENHKLLKNNTNSLYYSTDIGVDSNIYDMNSNTQFYLSVVQGKYETAKFTGNGRINQSFQINIPAKNKIENFKFYVTYNGIPIEIKSSINDMLQDEHACYARTSFDDGLAIYFGNNKKGFVPLIGSLITVEYLLTNGTDGNILNPIINDFKFVDIIKDIKGNVIDMEKLFNTEIYVEVGFASNGETPEYTKSILPNVSRNYVLATAAQFRFHFQRMNMFSKVNAFNKLNDNNYSVTFENVENSFKKLEKSIKKNDSKQVMLGHLDNFKGMYSTYKNIYNDNQIYLYLIPDIRGYFNSSVNYFNVPIDVFYLDDVEKQKSINYLRKLGTTNPNIEINIIQPKITKYVMFVYANIWEGYQKNNLKEQITEIVSNFMITNKRFDRVNKSDIINQLKDIEGLDSVDVYFISKTNEDYIKKNAAIDVKLTKKDMVKSIRLELAGAKEKEVNWTPGRILTNIDEETTSTIGLDPVLGDITMEKDEYALIRGGWSDRNGIYFDENINSNDNLTSINIIFDKIIKKQ